MDENYTLLAQAIIKQATDDYSNALRGVYIRGAHPDRVKREVRQFFFSDWYALLTKVDPHYLLRLLEEKREKEKVFMAEADKHRGDKKHKKYYFECPLCHGQDAYTKYGKRNYIYFCRNCNIYFAGKR